MRTLYTTLALVVAFALPFGTQAQTFTLDAPSLTPSQQSKLDGRLTRILQQSAEGTLQTALRSQPAAFNPAKQAAARSGARPSQPGGIDLSFAQSRAEGPPMGLPRYSIADLRPDARTASGAPLYDAVVRTRDAGALRRAGVSVTSSVGDIVTVRATPDALGRAASLPGVASIQSPRVLYPHNDIGTAEAGATALNRGALNGTAYTGEGVIGCVIDSGIDWSHPDFTAADGSSRIRYIWDQDDDSTGTPSPAERDPSRFGTDFTPNFGAEWRQADVEAGTVRQQDRDGHGTHVTGSLASSGRAYELSSGEKRYAGAAPNIDIVAVKAGDAGFSNTNVITGIQYCQSVAADEGKPVVINMSLGTDFAPHDGSSILARTVDILTDGGTAQGNVVVTSAGNSGSRNMHTQAGFTSGSAEATVTVPSYSPNPGPSNDFFFGTLYVYETGDYQITATAPNGTDSVSLTVLEDSTEFTSQPTPSGTVFLESAPDGDARYMIFQVFDAFADSPVADGTWSIRVEGINGSTPSGTMHGWFLQSQLGGEFTTFDGGDNAVTIGSPATAASALAVGNYWQQSQWYNSAVGSGLAFRGAPIGPINPSSSRGPTVDGRMKPAIAGPGTYTASALSDDTGTTPDNLFVTGDGEHRMLNGTSMSGPLVAGSIALLLQEDDALTTTAARDLVMQTARVDDFVTTYGSVPNTTFGAGKIDIQNAMARLLGEEESPSRVLSYHNPAFDPFNVSSEAVGGDGAVQAAMRFTPTLSGPVDGAYMTLDSGLSLTDSVYVEVWSNDGGTPGTRLGRVAVPGGAFRPFSPHYVPLDETGVSVTAGTDYHLAVTPKSSTDQLRLLQSTSASGRSSVLNGSTWSDAGNDFVMRVHVRFQYPEAIAASVDQPFGTGEGDSQDYRLVALPGDISRDLGDVLAGEQDRAWRAFWDTGADTDFLVPYDGSDTFRVRPGRGFWAVSSQPLSVSETVTPVSIENGVASIPLHAGWNIIANPFDKDVAWTSVESVNSGPLQPLWGFDGTFSATTTFTSAADGRAFYFLNDRNRSELVLPYPGAVVQPPAASATASARLASVGSTVALTAQPADGSDAEDAPTATARLTLTRNASAARSQPDIVAPPSTFAAVGIHLLDASQDADGEEPSARQRTLSHAMRPLSATDGVTLPVGVRTNGPTSVRLTLDADDALQGTDVALLDEATGRSYDVSAPEGVVLDMGDRSERTFTLAVGSAAFVQSQADALLPQEASLVSAPNPLRDQGTLTYRLPEASSTRLAVYDVLGRRVAVLVDGEQSAGTHTATWRPNTVASGVYFARLTTSTQTIVQKIVVVR